MKHPVRFDGLGPSGMARRFGDADRVAPDPDRLARARAVLSEVAPRHDLEAQVRLLGADSLLPPEKVKRKVAAKAAPKGKVGRPAKHSGKPWEAEGISRALWYRRKGKAG